MQYQFWQFVWQFDKTCLFSGSNLSIDIEFNVTTYSITLMRDCPCRCLCGFSVDRASLWGNHLSFMDQFSCVCVCVCVCFICPCARAGHGLLWTDKHINTHTHTHRHAPGDAKILGGAIFLEVSLKVMSAQRAEKHRGGMLICVERVILGYTALPTILGISSLPSQSQPRTQWCSAPLTGGIPRNCRVTTLASTAQSLSCLSHTSASSLPLVSAPGFLSHSFSRSASAMCVWTEDELAPSSLLPPDWLYRRQTESSSSPLSLLLPLSSKPSSTSYSSLALSLSLSLSPPPSLTLTHKHTHTLSLTLSLSLLLSLSLSLSLSLQDSLLLLQMSVPACQGDQIWSWKVCRCYQVRAHVSSSGCPRSCKEMGCRLLLCECVSVAAWMCVYVSVSRWHNQEGWVLWGCHRGSTLCYNSQPCSVTPILAPVFDAPFISMCTGRLFVPVCMLRNCCRYGVECSWRQQIGYNV